MHWFCFSLSINSIGIYICLTALNWSIFSLAFYSFSHWPNPCIAIQSQSAVNECLCWILWTFSLIYEKRYQNKKLVGWMHLSFQSDPFWNQLVSQTSFLNRSITTRALHYKFSLCKSQIVYLWSFHKNISPVLCLQLKAVKATFENCTSLQFT